MSLSQSIINKFNLAATTFIAIIIISFAAFNYLENKSNLEKEFNVEIEQLITRLKLNLPSALWDLRTEQVEQNIESELVADFITELTIYEDAQLTVVNTSREKLLNGDISTHKATPIEINSPSIHKIDLSFTDSFGDLHSVGTLILKINEKPLRQSIIKSLHKLIIEYILLATALILLLITLTKVILTPAIKI